jgi:hypothetical protein
LNLFPPYQHLDPQDTSKYHCYIKHVTNTQRSKNFLCLVYDKFK